MAYTTTSRRFLFKQHFSTVNIYPFSPNNPFIFPTLLKPSPITKLQITHKKFITKAITTMNEGKCSNEKVQQVHNIEDFDVALQTAGDKLVVVIFTAIHGKHNRKIYPFMVDLSRKCNDVEFVVVMGDESNKTKALCEREKIKKIPHFTFYKSMKKIHEEEGIIGPDELMRDVLYYGDNHSAVIQLHSKKDVENLIEEHRIDNKLIVIDIGLKHCGPCAKVYPTVLMLSRMMVDTVVFARMDGDENESCVQFLKDMGVVEAPTFMFLRDGIICGRYVGSRKVELIREIQKHRGVGVAF
ncbi:hypothetical protein MKW92_005085 [Papaver armeniacum]|nr:hypothetical protein MKW92_005085 [Papaver armeniacum]